ncbi:MAG: isoprenyl transferase [Planctomycetes bacterium]|nr:isoprenyl transferase [Planctomycetota bacterium]
MNNGLPNHVAFIMDGNGRWAEERGLPRAFGHRAGADTVRRVTEFACRRGIPHLTLYAFSTENWSRPKEEVDALMQLLGDFVKMELPNMLKNDVRLMTIGEPSALPEHLRLRLVNAMTATASCQSLVLTLAINYGGRDEIVRAARRACRNLAENGLPVESLDENQFAAALDTAGMPDPDLIIRTAGEMRLSNFLIWQAAYAEFVFTSRCWPDFSDSDFESALGIYAERTRKFGNIPECAGNSAF